MPGRTCSHGVGQTVLGQESLAEVGRSPSEGERCAPATAAGFDFRCISPVAAGPPRFGQWCCVVAIRTGPNGERR